MKKELAIFFGIIILAAISFYFVDLKVHPINTPDKEITADQLQKVISGRNSFSLVMYFEKEDIRNQAIVNCTTGLAQSLGTMGKVVKNYAIQGAYCIRSDLTNSTAASCSKEIGENYYFEIHYGSGSTKFYEKKTVIYVDESFQGECKLAFKEAS